MNTALPKGLGDSASLLQTALHQSFNAVLITDADLGPNGCRIVYCNPAFCQMTGYPALALLGQTPRLLQGQRTDRATLSRLRQHLLAGEPFHGHAVNYNAAGQTYDVEWHISPLRDPAGRITHFLSIQQDITALRDAERKRDLLAAALDAAPSALFITDLGGSLIFANQAFEQLTGQTVQAALGRTPAEIGFNGQGRDFYQNLLGAATHMVPLQATFANQRLDGSVFFCTQSISALTDATGAYTHFVTVATDVTAQVDLQRRLQSQASRDSLTGLLNRRAGDEVLRWCERMHANQQTPYALVLADIDHFKRVNDTWGHAVGDRVLRQVAQTLASGARIGDSVVRWGGEEFLLVLPGVGAGLAMDLAQRMRANVAALRDPDVGQVTLSFGVAESGGPWAAAGALLDAADRALYAAKALGRNRVELASHSAESAVSDASSQRWLERSARARC